MKLVAADSSEVDLQDTDSSTGEKLSKEEQESLTQWIKETLGEKVADVVASKRLVDSPAAALNSDKMMTPSMRRIMKAMNQDPGGTNAVRLEINPSHELIAKLNGLRESSPDLANLIAEQIYDNSMIAAGFIEDPRSMVNRIYDLLGKLG